MFMAARRGSDEGSLVPAARSVPIVAGDTPAMRDWAEQLVARARSEGVELTGDDGLLTAMVGQVLQTGLGVELADHLGYEPYDPAGRGSGNSRNGTTPKTVTTEIGDVELRVPRDRSGTFDPQTVPKHQRRLDGLTGNVISLYAKGMTTGDIQAHLLEIYGTDISRETISKITDRSSRTCSPAAPAFRSCLSGVVDRRDRDRGPRRPGREPGPCMSRLA
jgi:putative transposase